MTVLKIHVGYTYIFLKKTFRTIDFRVTIEYINRFGGPLKFLMKSSLSSAECVITPFFIFGKDKFCTS